MGLKLEVGKFYRTRDGRKVECTYDDAGNVEPCCIDHGSYELWHDRDGKSNLQNRSDDLIAEWTDAPTGPVRTVTRTTREIVPGVYDGLDVGQAVDGHVFIAMGIHRVDAEAIDALIANLTAIRDAMEENHADHP